MKESFSHRAAILYVPVFGMAFGLLLTLLGLFSPYAIVAVALLAALFLVALLRRSILPKRFSDGALLVFLLLLSLFIGWFHHAMPVFRDEMSFLYAARELRETSDLTWQNFFSHGSHGVRDLGEDRFTSQFLPGYLVPLAVMDGLFGLEGMYWTNAVFYFLSLLVFLALFSLFPMGRRRFLAFLGVFALSIPVVWFSRRTNNEVAYLFLFWLSAYSLTRGWLERRALYPLFGLLPGLYLAFMRPEGVIYAVLYLAVFFGLIWRLGKGSRALPLCLSAASIVVALGFYASLLRQTGSSYVLGHTLEILQPLFSYPLIGVSLLLMTLVVVWLLFAWRKTIRIRFVPVLATRIFPAFFIAIAVLCGLAALWILLAPHGVLVLRPVFKFVYAVAALSVALVIPLLFWTVSSFRGRVKEFVPILPLLILALPSFAFLFEAFIALDLPWYYRRFLPTFIPLVFFLFAYFLFDPMKKRLSGHRRLILLSFFIGTLALSIPFLTFRDHEGIEVQLSSFAERFDSTQDILIMQEGWTWQRWSQALHYFYGAPVFLDEQRIPDTRIQAAVDEYERALYIYKGAPFPRALPSMACASLLEPYKFTYPELVFTDTLVGHVSSNEYISLGIPQKLIRTTWPFQTQLIEEEATVCELGPIEHPEEELP